MSMTVYRRLNRNEINLLLYLLRRCCANFPGVGLSPPARSIAVPLWRRGIVNVWYRVVPEVTPNRQGPFFCLSAFGRRLAAAFSRPSGARASS